MAKLLLFSPSDRHWIFDSLPQDIYDYDCGEVDPDVNTISFYRDAMPVEFTNHVKGEKDRISEEWVKLLEYESKNKDICSAFDAASLADKMTLVHLLDGICPNYDVLIAVNDTAILAMIHAQTRYVCFCDETVLTLLQHHQIASIFIFALSFAITVVSKNQRVKDALAENGIPSVLSSEISWSFVASQLEKGRISEFDSLKQKRCEIEYEGLYGSIYDAKYHDAICYQIMDKYLVDIIANTAIPFIDKADKVKILDLGCGPGSMVRLLQDKIDMEYIGVDISKSMVDLAQQRYPYLHFEIGDAEKLQFDNNTFDIVMCSGMLHHLPDVEIVLREIHRVLKPRGALVAREPNELNFALKEPEVAFVHTCLRNLIHIANGTFAITEPEEHEYHKEFDYKSLPAVMSQYFWMENLYTNQKISYFYDMLMEHKFLPIIENLENSLHGQPGLNIVSVARKISQCGAAFAVKETTVLLDKCCLCELDRHLNGVLDLFFEICEKKIENIFFKKLVSPKEIVEKFKLTSHVLVVDPGLSSETAQIWSSLVSKGWISTDKELCSYSTSEPVPFEQQKRYSHVEIHCSADIPAKVLKEQMERCRDYGVIHLVFKDGVKITECSDAYKAYFHHLSPLPFPLRRKYNFSGYMEFFLSRSFFTRRNFIESMEILVDKFNLQQPLLGRIVAAQKLNPHEDLIKFSWGSFYDFIESF